MKILLRYWFAFIGLIICILDTLDFLIVFLFAFYFMNDKFQHKKLIFSKLKIKLELYCNKKIFKIY